MAHDAWMSSLSPSQLKAALETALGRVEGEVRMVRAVAPRDRAARAAHLVRQAEWVAQLVAKLDALETDAAEPT